MSIDKLEVSDLEIDALSEAKGVIALKQALHRINEKVEGILKGVRTKRKKFDKNIEGIKSFLLDAEEIRKIVQLELNEEFGQILDVVKSDHKFMDKIINLYLNMLNNGSGVFKEAIFRKHFISDKFLLEIYNRTKLNKTLVLIKIRDEEILKKIAENLRYNYRNKNNSENNLKKDNIPFEYRLSGHYPMTLRFSDDWVGFNSHIREETAVLFNINYRGNEQYFKNIIEDKKANIYLRAMALNKITDLEYLQEIANNSYFRYYTKINPDYKFKRDGWTKERIEFEQEMTMIGWARNRIKQLTGPDKKIDLDDNFSLGTMY